MKYIYRVERDEPLNARIIIPCRTSDIPKIRDVLRLHGVPEVGQFGGHGYIVAEGEVSITGTLSACELAARAILYLLNGPSFRSGDRIAEERRRGAMPV